MPGTLLAQLGAVARATREAAGLRQIDIATAAEVAHTAISRFERGESWPRDPEWIIDRYATEVGVPAVELWRRALEAWA